MHLDNTRFLFAALLAASLAGSQAFAQQPARAPAVADATTPMGVRDGAPPAHHQGRGSRAARLAHAVRHDPALAVVMNLRAIERVYREDGRSDEVPAFYREQLARTQDPLVRNFVHYRLARLELRGDDAKAALEALRRNLDENYRRL